MSAPPAEPDDRHSRILSELAGLGLELARDLQRRALEADDARDAARLSEAFHKVSRGVRQTLALDQKLSRLRHDQARDDAADDRRRAREAATLAARTRKAAVRRAVSSLIWTEHERDDAEPLIKELDDWLDASDLDHLADTPLEVLLADACRTLGLPSQPVICGAPVNPFLADTG